MIQDCELEPQRSSFDQEEAEEFDSDFDEEMIGKAYECCNHRNQKVGKEQSMTR